MRSEPPFAPCGGETCGSSFPIPHSAFRTGTDAYCAMREKCSVSCCGNDCSS